MAIAIRPASPDDVAPIDRLLAENFPRPAEAGLVRELARAGDLTLVMVAEDDEAQRLVGMVAFSRMEVEIDAVPFAAVAMAPVAVERAHRRAGVAEALIEAGLDWLARSGVQLAFVLGDPAFYGRFGFETALAARFASPYSGEYFMARGLGGKLPCHGAGVAAHAAAFAALGETDELQ